MPSLTRTQQRIVQLATCLTLLAGCSSPPALIRPPGPLQLPPNLEESVHHHFGTLLGGARTAPKVTGESAAPGTAVDVEIRFLFLEGHADEGLTSLAEHTRMVANPEADQPIRGATRFAVGAGFAMGPSARELWSDLEAGSAGRSMLTKSYCGPLPAGVSSVFRLEAQEQIEDPDNFLGEWPQRGPVLKRLALGMQLDEQAGVSIGLGFSDLAQGDRALEAGSPPEGGTPHGEYLQHEWLVPDLKPDLEGGPLVFVVPSPFESGEGRTCAIWVEARTRSTEDSMNAAEAAEPEVLHASLEKVLTAAHGVGRQVTLAQQPASPEELQIRNLLRAYAALHQTTDGARWRGLLLNLSISTGGPMAEDLAMIADERTLGAWIDSLPALDTDLKLDVLQLGWRLERSAWRYLSKLAMNEGLPLWLEALCVRHGGEIGRYPSTIEQTSLRAVDRASFHLLIVQGNLISLEDSNVSARVRSYDWLLRLNMAPTGYDPLGSEQDRRSAMAAYNAAQLATTNN